MCVQHFHTVCLEGPRTLNPKSHQSFAKTFHAWDLQVCKYGFSIQLKYLSLKYSFLYDTATTTRMFLTNFSILGFVMHLHYCNVWRLIQKLVLFFFLLIFLCFCIHFCTPPVKQDLLNIYV